MKVNFKKSAIMYAWNWRIKKEYRIKKIKINEVNFEEIPLRN